MAAKRPKRGRGWPPGGPKPSNFPAIIVGTIKQPDKGKQAWYYTGEGWSWRKSDAFRYMDERKLMNDYNSLSVVREHMLMDDIAVEFQEPDPAYQGGEPCPRG